MTDKQLFKLALDALEQTLETLDNENSKPGGAIADTIWHSEHETLFDYLTSTIDVFKERLAQPEQEPICPDCKAKVLYECVACSSNNYPPPQRTEQVPVAHLWECLGRWSAYLANNGTQAECAPPSWLVEAVKNATTPPQRTEQEPVAWQFFQGGKWHNGMEVNDHRNHTEAAGVPVRDLYATPPQPKQEPVAWPCLIDSADFSENTITLVMQCEDYKVSAGTHWLSTTPPKEKNT
jgi:hypothetical protein